MKGRLLIVDDEPGIVLALKGLFRKEGYEVETLELLIGRNLNVG